MGVARNSGPVARSAAAAAVCGFSVWPPLVGVKSLGTCTRQQPLLTTALAFPFSFRSRAPQRDERWRGEESVESRNAMLCAIEAKKGRNNESGTAEECSEREKSAREKRASKTEPLQS